MRLLNWRVAAVAAALVLAGSASAQEPYAVPRTKAYVMSAPVAEAPVAHKHNGHCATFLREASAQSGGNYWCSNCPNAQRCNNYAGSFVADLGFGLGPTKSFFDPCGPRVLPDCSGSGGGCHKCRTPIFGRGPSGPWSHCTYDSFMNH